jgi:uncharacterized protein YaaQ
MKEEAVRELVRKLSKSQIEVLELMSRGWILRSGGAGLILGLPKQSAYNITRNVTNALLRRKLIATPVQSKTWHWTLTELGLAALRRVEDTQ